MRNFWWLQLVIFGILCSNKVFIHGSRVWIPECINENGENICIHGQKRMIDQSFYSGYGKRKFIIAIFLGKLNIIYNMYPY
ncbi:hypothetical protein AHF37_12805 [Paragonimus kellicotti]|nr:hypothetical protein AHF37_12805 [Paragonimus kellicotti]